MTLWQSICDLMIECNVSVLHLRTGAPNVDELNEHKNMLIRIYYKPAHTMKDGHLFRLQVAVAAGAFFSCCLDRYWNTLKFYIYLVSLGII